VRPLYDDGASAAQAATRDYVLAVDADDGQPALLSVFGGKITTYRRLAEHALEKLSPFLGGNVEAKKGWTGREPLPGGEFPGGTDRRAGRPAHQPLRLPDAARTRRGWCGCTARAPRTCWARRNRRRTWGAISARP
jgi:glycerol-3-phosphate dehydrogenase